MARHGENIYRRKDGRYEGRYVKGRENGKTRFGYVYGHKYTEVKQKLAIRKAEYMGTVLPDKNSDSRNISVERWIRVWLEQHIKLRAKPSTYSIYRGQMEKYVIPAIGSCKLQEIGSFSIQSLFLNIRKKGGAEQTAQNVCKRFLSVLRYARENGMIRAVPPMPFSGKVSKAAPRCLTPAEQRQLEGKLDLGKQKDFAVYLSMYTGIRIGECCALKWKDIDLKEGRIHVHHTVQRIRRFEEDQKTGLQYMEAKTDRAVRMIPLIRPLQEALQDMKEKNPASSDSFLLTGSDLPMDPRTLQHHIKKISAQAEIGGLHFHTLRHTFATRCMEQEVDMKSLSEVLGHSSVQNTLNWYCHSSDQQKIKMLNRLNQYTIRKIKPS